VTRVAGTEDVPAAVADYLSQHNLPSHLVMTPDPRLDGIPWARRPLLEFRRGRAEDADQVGVTACFAAIAETGTLMLVSGPESPTRNNFLPETHIVVVRSADVAATYEEGWMRLRHAKATAEGGVAMPRTVNFITGPSRTGDIEQRLELGAHGPRRLHIVLIDDGAAS
jgi:L-lactate dehydrogenase complex protein LldG